MARFPLPFPKVKMRHAAIFLLAVSFVQAAPVAELVEQGDALDLKNENARALALYLDAEKLDAKNAEILRRVAKQYALLMTGPGADAKTLGEKALAYAKQAVKAGPDNTQAHLALAIVYGQVALLRSPKERLEYSKLIQSEAQKSIALDSGNDLAWHVLGRWNYEIANLSGPLKFFAETLYGKMPDASNEKALECFRKAVAVNPRRLVNQAELGRTLAVIGRKEEARATLEKALQMPSREKDDEETKARARKALAALD